MLDATRLNLLNVLLMLISKTDNTQEAFGAGCAVIDSARRKQNANNQNIYGLYPMGHSNLVGRWRGRSPSLVAYEPMKVFYIENWWGYCKTYIPGLVLVNGKLYKKAYPPYSIESIQSTSDITTLGYVDTGITYTQYTNWIKGSITDADLARIPSTFGGSGTTYQCDVVYCTTAGKKMCVFGVLPTESGMVVNYSGCWGLRFEGGGGPWCVSVCAISPD